MTEWMALGYLNSFLTRKMAALGVADYRVGNMRSVANALNKIGAEWELVNDPLKVPQYSRLLLPGVGAFGPAAVRLGETGLGKALVLAARAGTPLMGICLGMQLLGRTSEESPSTQGLALLEASTVRLPPHHSVTNTGFRKVEVVAAFRRPNSSTLVCDYYFNHGYHFVPEEKSVAAAATQWGEVEIVSAVSRDNVMGVQFHPEKSQGQGLAVLDRFARSGDLLL